MKDLKRETRTKDFTTPCSHFWHIVAFKVSRDQEKDLQLKELDPYVVPYLSGIFLTDFPFKMISSQVRKESAKMDGALRNYSKFFKYKIDKRKEIRQ